MARVLQGTKESKRERQRAAADARALVRKRRAQRRTLAYVLGGCAAIAIAVVVLFALVGEQDDRDQGGSTRISPSRPGEVTVSGPARAEPLERGEAVPAFTSPGIRVVTDLPTGEPTVRREGVSWSPGEPTVISIWAPWCPHCQAELPFLARVAREYPEVSFVTIVTSIGTSPGPDAGVFMAEEGITMPTAIDDTQGTLGAAFGIQGFPTLYFVGSDGTITQMTEGEIDEDALGQIIGSLT